MKDLFFALLRAAFGVFAGMAAVCLAGEIGALTLDLHQARLVGSGLALCIGAALAVSRPRWLKRAGLVTASMAAVLLAPPLRLGRLAARWGITGYYAVLGALFACTAVSLGAALSLLPLRRACQPMCIRS